MADRRKTKKKKEFEEDKIPKVEYNVAKYLRNKLPNKKTTLLGHKVDYFIASKAVDCLLDSQWAKEGKDTLFTTRESVLEFMDSMLRHKFFHRAKKIIVTKDSSKKKKKSDVDESSCGEDTNKEKDKAKTNKSLEKKKEKKKIKLDMHMEQTFIDMNEPYVWIYDHIPLKTWIIGAGLVFGAVAICLFPLWPRSVRNYVYYLSIAAAAFLFFIIGLVVLRIIIFVLAWLVTFGKHHLWILPNLTEDVGFLESFWPLYKHDYKGDSKKGNVESKSNEDNESETHKENDENAKKDAEESESGSDNENDDNKADTDVDQRNGASGTDTNGFEILDSNELKDGGKVKTS